MTSTQPFERAFQITSVDLAVISAIRRGGPDASGRAAALVEATGGEPLRCCLRDAGSGESLLLFGYEPPLPPSPYSEVGAVFVHEEACPGHTPTSTYPPQWRWRPQVLRAYDRRGWIHAAVTHQGGEPEAAITDLLADPDVVQIHSRNLAYGCYMMTITRTPPGERSPG
jgi:Protein of unknown function (DUF1203)